MLLGMGFDVGSARHALQESHGDVQAAAERLLVAPPDLKVSEAFVPDNQALAAAEEHAGVKRKRKRENRPSDSGSAVQEHEQVTKQDSSASSPSVEENTHVEAVNGVQSRDKATEELSKMHTVSYLSSEITFGDAAFGPLRPVADLPMMHEGKSAPRLNVKKIVEASVPGVKHMMGERGAKYVTQMLSDCYFNGLFMHGPPTSAVNMEIIPAVQYIFRVFNDLPPKDSKRVSYLTALANACQDCQQVQAREIMRAFGDLTSQNDTFEGQLRYSLVRQKEAALNRYISRQHARCDEDHRNVQPWQQRAHLTSGYIALIGESFGFDGVAAAKNDRFLPQVQQELGRISVKSLQKALLQDMSPKEWLQTLLSDINNQTAHSDRLINRNCIFKWVQNNMSQESAHLVFYDEERACEFEDLDPKAPIPENQYQPFLSPKVLVDMLSAAGMLKYIGSSKDSQTSSMSSANRTRKQQAGR
jgi:hypothetical protein